MTIDRKPRFKWTRTIVIILFAGLIYAVYFTDLGRPETSESEKSITTYSQTAVPTIYVQWSPVPVIELDWAYASRNLLKFAIIVHNLEQNMDPVDWICYPQVTIDKPVLHRLRAYEMTPIYDASGASVRATYEYGINAGDYDSLTVNTAIIIGPCTDYLNFAETNVTPFVKPELVGRYYLSFQVPVKPGTPVSSLPLRSTPMDTWRSLPIFPGGIESNDLTVDYPVYHYIVENADIDTVRHFYEEQMQTTEWELLGALDKSVAKLGEAYSLWFAKDQDVVTIEVFIYENTTHVFIRLE